MKLARRKFLRMAAGDVALPTVSRLATAQTYPAHSVRIVSDLHSAVWSANAAPRR